MKYRVSEKDCILFFSRCPVCGEWCKLHWLLLDTPSFDWNTRRSRGHKILKMAPTKNRIFLKRYNLFSDILYFRNPSNVTMWLIRQAILRIWAFYCNGDLGCEPLCSPVACYGTSVEHLPPPSCGCSFLQHRGSSPKCCDVVTHTTLWMSACGGEYRRKS